MLLHDPWPEHSSPPVLEPLHTGSLQPSPRKPVSQAHSPVEESHWPWPEHSTPSIFGHSAMEQLLPEKPGEQLHMASCRHSPWPEQAEGQPRAWSAHISWKAGQSTVPWPVVTVPPSCGHWCHLLSQEKLNLRKPVSHRVSRHRGLLLLLGPVSAAVPTKQRLDASMVSPRIELAGVSLGPRSLQSPLEYASKYGQ